MNELERLQTWLARRECSLPQLARELEMPYQTLYHQVIVRKRITGDTRWAFMKRFGLEEATLIFDPESEATPS